jgi:hypothetical protein
VRDNPGQPGKGGPKLVRTSPLHGTQVPVRQADITSSSGWCRNHLELRTRSCAARRDQKPRSSRVRQTGRFDRNAHAVTQRVSGCYCKSSTATPSRRRRKPPRKAPGRTVGARNGKEASGSGRARQSPQNLLAWGGCVKRGHPTAIGKAT